MAETYCEEREGCAIHFAEPLAQLVEHRPFKPRVVGSIPTRLTLQDLVLARKILGALRRRKRPGRVRQQTVSKRSRFFGPDPAHGVRADPPAPGVRRCRSWSSPKRAGECVARDRLDAHCAS